MKKRNNLVFKECKCSLSISSTSVNMRTLAALLALVLVISVNAQYGVTTLQCCGEHYSKTIPAGKVVSYSTTSSGCHLKAHVFKTVAGKEFCVNPDLAWVKKIVTKLDKKPSAA
ncbi:monocyte chemotactic protein 1B-like [Clupea harengus]|uniref:Monocyte chemotactic protein 1B-like n=1 Tax=Clupea harengus TaxID=7950 RepID=A0A6P3VJH2_CLUHA|nr:monocyte chemotactic protein 1B-like [Clupea harengus]XP_031420461.1 monocyte chemotactic protein 1B-like [Clupea harengus]